VKRCDALVQGALVNLILLGAGSFSFAQVTVPAEPPKPVPAGPGALSDTRANPYPSTYKAPPSKPFVVVNANLLTAAGPVISGGAISVRDGKIIEVGAKVATASDAQVIDGKGRFLTPGIIDVHSHLGVMSAPLIPAHMDINETLKPNEAGSWAEHSVWPQDPQFAHDLMSGVTTLQILPGSAVLFGGRSVILKPIPARTVQEMKFPGAPYGLKMASGENPKRIFKDRGPATRMGLMATLRGVLIDAEQYGRNQEEWKAHRTGVMPKRDLALETIWGALKGDILIHIHCYRSADMANYIDLSHEFGFKIRTFQHSVEAYKIADILAKEGIGAAVWSDLGAFKAEAMDAIKANAALVFASGARVMAHSDDPSSSQRLNQEVAKEIEAGSEIGITIREDEAIKWITLNPAWAIGLEKQIGSLEKGKNADIVLWSGNPFSVYSRADLVWVDGSLRYDRSKPDTRPANDFDLGHVPGVDK
jgi:imidazolonepropionase-like amidohydrolase